jgi:hypothetical protein
MIQSSFNLESSRINRRSAKKWKIEKLWTNGLKKCDSPDINLIRNNTIRMIPNPELERNTFQLNALSVKKNERIRYNNPVAGKRYLKYGLLNNDSVS